MSPPQKGEIKQATELAARGISGGTFSILSVITGGSAAEHRRHAGAHPATDHQARCGEWLPRCGFIGRVSIPFSSTHSSTVSLPGSGEKERDIPDVDNLQAILDLLRQVFHVFAVLGRQ